MREDYKIFRFDSRNTGYYLQDFYQPIKVVRDYAKTWAGEHYRIEGEDGFFEEYEDGEKTSWST